MDRDEIMRVLAIMCAIAAVVGFLSAYWIASGSRSPKSTASAAHDSAVPPAIEPSDECPYDPDRRCYDFTCDGC